MSETKSQLAFVVALKKENSKECEFEFTTKDQSGATMIHNLVGGYFARAASNLKSGWNCFVNDDFCAVPEINEPLSILIQHLQKSGDQNEVVPPCFGNGVIVFSNPNKHPKIIGAIREWMKLYNKYAVSSPETCSREEATENYWSYRSLMIYSLKKTKLFDFFTQLKE